MGTAKLQLADISASMRTSRQSRPAQPAHWERAELAGRFCELSSHNGGGLLSAAFHLVLDSQAEGQPVVWISAGPDLFFPPDAEACGVDLESLVVVKVAGVQAAGRVADRLIRSGAFGLIVADLGAQAQLPMPLQGRLVQLARTHDTAFLCLTEKTSDEPSLGSMVSLRGQTTSERLEPERFRFAVEIIKDKRRGPGWQYQEFCCGPPGLC